ncbi:peptidylprolyl isomerase [Chlorobium sp. N1]|uniref:peptidylprolyl isomerase n=1 Tax=Chlorobium sp. N1 TaxID=2491138 RepID=UPI00103BFD02|nr:peptidylprolyl isomerase [Chlorobium sp. N1]TCD48208.1 peptidylprolyl isomerase [Chlorobium sp. N1]
MKKALPIVTAIVAVLLAFPHARAAAAVADRVVAVVGSEVIFKSELDSREVMTRMQYPDLQKDPTLRSSILDNLIDQKIILTKAKIDSVGIDENAVASMSADRLRQLSSRFASKEDMERKLGRSVEAVRRDLADELRGQQMIETLKRRKFSSVTIGYGEVMAFYRNNRAKMPDLPEEVSISQILKFPGVNSAAKAEALTKIKEIQKKLETGFLSFEELARRYSMDPGSATLGGDLGFVQRGELVKPFEDAAYGLKDGRVSGIVETRYGYHIIQRLGREGNSIHVRHILVAFERSTRDDGEAAAFLGAIRSKVLAGKVDFATMARNYSDDPISASLGGQVLASGTAGRYLDPRMLRPQLRDIVSTLGKPGDISQPTKITPPKGEPFFGIFRLNDRVAEHVLDPEKDYPLLEQLALDQKKQGLFEAWMKDLRREVYVRRIDG